MTAYPTWNPDAPEESFNNLIRQLELRDDDLREGNYRAITGNQLQEKTVGTVNLRDQAITSDKIEDGSIIHVKLGVSSVWGDKLGLEAVSGGHIKVDAVSGGHIEVSAVSAGHLDSNAVITAKIATGAVTGPKIAATAVSTGHLQNSAVTGIKIATSTIEETNLNFSVKQRYLVGPWTYLNPTAGSTGLVTFYLVTNGAAVGAFNNGFPYAVGRACRLTGVYTRVSNPRTNGKMVTEAVSSLQGFLNIATTIDSVNFAYASKKDLAGPLLTVGEGIGVALTTDASWAPDTNQHVLVWLEFTEV